MTVSNDNEMAYKWVCLKMHWAGNRCCRFCDMETSVFYSDYTLNNTNIFKCIKKLDRNYFNNNILQGQLFRLWIRQLNKNRINYIITAEDKRIIEEGKSLNLYPIINPLLPLFNYLHDKEISNIYRSSIVDHLHTINKGIIEYTLKYTIKVIHQINSLVPSNNKIVNSLSLLDEKISTFPIFQSMQLFSKNYIQLKQGISNISVEDGKIQGCQIESSNMIQYLFQVMLCIGYDGKILQNYILTINNEMFNPTFIVLTACYEAFQLYCYLRKPNFNKHVDIPILSNLLRTSAQACCELIRINRYMGKC